MNYRTVTLPSGLEAIVKPLTGRAEKILTDKQLIKNGTAADRFMAECVESIGGAENMTPQQKEKALLDMYSGDRNYLLLMIRIEGFGPELCFNSKCPECKKTAGYTANLEEMLADGTFKIHPYGENPRRVELPVSGGYAEIVHMTGAIERRMAKLPENDLHQLMLLRIASLNGNPATIKDLENMYGRDLLALRSAMNEMRGGLAAEIELECAECGNTYTVPLTGIQDFFLPAKTSLAKPGA